MFSSAYVAAEMILVSSLFTHAAAIVVYVLLRGAAGENKVCEQIQTGIQKRLLIKWLSCGRRKIQKHDISKNLQWFGLKAPYTSEEMNNVRDLWATYLMDNYF